MEELRTLLGKAQGLCEAADDVRSLRAALNAALKALEKALDELDALRGEKAELEEYVNRMDEDLSHLEFLHEDELDDFDDDFDEDDEDFDDEEEEDPDHEDLDAEDAELTGDEEDELDSEIDFEQWRKKHDK